MANHKDEEATNVIVTDVLPADLDFVSASNGGTFSNGVVSWDLGTLASGEEVTVTYVGKVDDQTGSLRLFRDEMEDDSEWISLFTEGDLEFYLQEFEVYTGDFAWYAEDLAVETDMTLEYINSLIVSGTNPAITFWHKYNTEAAADAGFLEIRRINEQQWVRFDADKVYRNGYPSSVQYGTFAIPFLYGFSGNSNGWVQSYFDLSDYAGEEVTIRFRFGTDDNTGGESWVVDDVEMQDVLFFDEEACVTSGQGDQACARAPERGVIVTPIGSVPTFETLENAFAIRVQPNPATDMLYLNASIDLDGPSTTSLIGMDGRVVLARQAVSIKGGQLLALDVSLVPAGVYTLRVDNAKGSSVVKVVIQ
ncbi:MAG: T9SS type A sorting domain-containing protein [Saprospiraceae bacterium]